MNLRNIINGFLKSSERFPSRPALVVGRESLTYTELRSRVSQVARAIVRYEHRDSSLVAILASRSVMAYAGVLGILAAGKGYVPLNPHFPLERIHRMLALSCCSALIVGKECMSQLPGLLANFDHSLTVIAPELDDAYELRTDFPKHHYVFSKEVSEKGEFSFDHGISALAIAYLLFTSGSTGEPKGVPVTHSNVQSYVNYVSDLYGVNETDRFSQHTDLTFDLSAHDMFVCWERGASLYCLPEKATLMPAKFIRDNQLTMWFSVPSVIGMLVKMKLLSPGIFPSLRCSLFCGEPLPGSYAERWQNAAPQSVVENLYGPTETTIAISHYRWHATHSLEECVNGMTPIGRMFAGQRSLIADANQIEVPCETVGELCLAGSQVTYGYWNASQKTQENFIHIPATPGLTWYRTGDLAKQDKGGLLHHLGRIDQQVKIRGFRVELQEIEAVLRRACAADQVVSLPWPVENGSAEGVVAFVSDPVEFDEQQARARCGRVLPEYMVPRRIYVMNDLPLSANGKIDRKGLRQLLERGQV